MCVAPLAVIGLALATGGCLIAPAAPGDAGPVAGDAPPACAALAGLTAQDALPVAVAVPEAGGLDRLVRGGSLAGGPVLLLHQADAAFSPTCPDAVLDLMPGRTGIVVAVTPLDATHLIALVDLTLEASMALVSVDLGASAPEVKEVGVPLAAATPLLAVSGPLLLAGHRDALFQLDLSGGFAAATPEARTAPGDPLLALAAVDPSTGHGWVASGRGAEYVVATADASFVSVASHGASCSESTQAGCLPRVARVVTSSRLVADDPARVVAVSVDTAGGVITLQNRAAPARTGAFAGLVVSDLQDAEVTDLPITPAPRLLVVAGAATSATLYLSTITFAPMTTQLTEMPVTRLALPAMEGPLRVVTGRFEAAEVAHTVVLGRRGAAIDAACVDPTAGSPIGC